MQENEDTFQLSDTKVCGYVGCIWKRAALQLLHLLQSFVCEQ